MVQVVSSRPVVYLEENGGGFSTSENSIMLPKGDSISVGGLGVESKRLKLSEPGTNQQEEEILLNMSMGMVTSSLPLGLSLRKTRSFVELIQARLCQEREMNHPTKKAKESSELGRGRAKKEAERLKANSWNVKLLKIGFWERRPIYDQDLVAKCYYQNKKLVWEMLDGKLKRKMEIRWSDITAIRAAFPENSNAVLEIEISTTPLFFRETTPQPRKQSSWETSSDFTHAQATRYRMHHLQFKEGTLRPYYEKLLQCDKRLLILSQQPFSTDRASYFHLNMPRYQYYPSHFHNLQPRVTSQYSVPSLLPQMYTSDPAYIASSPLSVMEFPHNKNHRGHYSVEPMVVQSASLQSPSSSGNGLTPSFISKLENIDNELFHSPAPSSYPDEQELMATVNSMGNLIQPSQEETPINNNFDTADSGYIHSINNLTMSRSPTESNESQGLMPREFEYWLPDMGVNENPLMHHERTPSFVNFFQALEEFAPDGFAMG